MVHKLSYLYIIILQYDYTVEYEATTLYTSFNTTASVNVTEGPIPPIDPSNPGTNLGPGGNPDPDNPRYPNIGPNIHNLCDLKINIIANLNPVKQGSTITYAIYIENFGPGDAYSLIVSYKLPKLEKLVYSFSGTEWHPLTGSIKIDKLNRNEMIIIYIGGILPSSLTGKAENIVEVKSFTPDSDHSNNRASIILTIDEDIDPYICGPVALQKLLASKGIFESLETLKQKLKPVDGMVSMAMMNKIASEYGVGLNAVKINSNELKKGDIARLIIDGVGHYVTIQSIDSNYVVYDDPIYGIVKVTRAEFEKLYSGYALSEGNKEKEIAKEEQEGLTGGVIALALLGMSALLLPRKTSTKTSTVTASAKNRPAPRNNNMLRYGTQQNLMHPLQSSQKGKYTVQFLYMFGDGGYTDVYKGYGNLNSFIVIRIFFNFIFY